MSEAGIPRKVDASEVEILGARGETIREKNSGPEHPRGFQTGRIKVWKGGPALLLFLPLLIPLAIVALFFLMLAALLFGKGVMKVVTTGVRRR